LYFIYKNMVKYMVCIDGSECGKKAYNAACKFINKETDHLYIFMGEEDLMQVSSFPLVIPEYVVSLQEKEDQRCKEILRFYGAEAKSINIPHTLILGHGNVKELMVKEVDEKQIDFLVMGRRGLNKIERFFVGSNTKYALENANCCLIIIK